MVDRATHTQIYQAFKDEYKVLPYLSAALVRGTTNLLHNMPFVRDRFVPVVRDGESPEAVAQRTADNIKLAENIVNDAFNVAAFSAVDWVSLRRERNILVDIYRRPVAEELGKVPETITISDLRKSKNMLVRMELERYSVRNTWAWAVNIPFAFVAAMPFFTKPINRIGHAVLGEQWGDIKDRVPDQPVAADQPDGEGKKNKKKKKKDKSEKGASDAGGGELQVEQSVKGDLTPLQLSGQATRPIMGVKVPYFAYYTLSQGTTSTTGMEDLNNLTRRVNEELHSRHLVNGVYNRFIEDLQGRHPEYFGEKPGLLRRIGHAVTAPVRFLSRRLGGRDEDAQKPLWQVWGIHPLSVESGDIYSRGVFKLMSESMRVAEDPRRYLDYGMRNQFGYSAFAYLVGHGFVDINNPDITQLWVRIGGLEGVSGLKAVETLLEQEAQAHRGDVAWKPDMGRMRQILQGYYAESLAREMNQAGIAEEITLTIQRDDGKVETKVVDGFVAADVLGPYLLDYMLGGLDRVRVAGGSRPLRREITLNQAQYEEFVREFEAKLRSETRPDFRLRTIDEGQIKALIDRLVISGSLALTETALQESRRDAPYYTTKNVISGNLAPTEEHIVALTGEGRRPVDQRLVQVTEKGRQSINTTDVAWEASRYGHTIPERPRQTPQDSSIVVAGQRAQGEVSGKTAGLPGSGP